MAGSTSACAVVDIEAFDKINKEMQEYDEMRETIIKESRDTQKLSKQAIYCLHRGDIQGAETKLKKAIEAAQKLEPLVTAEPWLRLQGSYCGSLEEIYVLWGLFTRNNLKVFGNIQWAEGMIFKAFLTEGRIPSMSEMPMLTRDEYLGGVLDFTGELNRYAVMRATERDIAAVKKCRDVVDSLMGIFLEFDFRNGALRKKFDTLKYTLKKMETTLYEQSLTENLGFRKETEAPAPDAEGGGDDGMGDEQ